jgi:hypothetical protein
MFHLYYFFCLCPMEVATNLVGTLLVSNGPLLCLLCLLPPRVLKKSAWTSHWLLNRSVTTCLLSMLLRECRTWRYLNKVTCGKKWKHFLVQTKWYAVVTTDDKTGCFFAIVIIHIQQPRLMGHDSLASMVEITVMSRWEDCRRLVRGETIRNIGVAEPS